MVYVIFSKDKRSMEKFKGLSWSYLGSNNGLYDSEAILGPDKRDFVGKEIERIVSTVRSNFVDYIGLISTLQKNRVLWYSSRVASKSSSQMAMFHQYVHIKLIESHIPSEGDHIFLVDDLQLLANLKRIRLPNVEVAGGMIPDPMNITLKKIRKNWLLLDLFVHWAFFRLFLPSGSPKNGDVLLNSFIDSRVFSRPSGYNDPYFGELEDFLNKNDHSVFRITPLSMDLKFAFMLKNRFKNIALLLPYLKLTDLLRIIITRMSIEYGLPAGNGIKDMELLDLLLKNEERNENETNGFKLYLSYYCCYRNLAERMPSGTSIIYTFENQPWEKMLNLAFGKKFKKIAYQHTIIEANWLDYRVSVFEKGSPAPDVILTSGNKWLDFFKEYYPECRIENAGAIRLDHIFSGAKSQCREVSRIIVVALPISAEIAIQLQKQVLACLAGGGFSGYKFLVKSHPYLLKSALFASEFLRYDNCEITEKGMNRLLENCRLLVTSGSTAAFEALSLGVKTLYFIPEVVSAGGEYFIREYLELAFADDFREKLIDALKVTAPVAFKVEEFFSPPDYRVFLRQLA